MSLTNPYGTPRPCRGCEHWGGDVPGTLHARCVHDGLQIHADAARGCVFWVRAIGSDDEPAPAGTLAAPRGLEERRNGKMERSHAEATGKAGESAGLDAVND
jgi:hypothetical protein